MGKARTLVAGGVVGALLAYFLDPDLGPARRARVHDSLGAALRLLLEGTRGASTELEASSTPHAIDDDLTVLNRVEGALLGLPDFPRGSVNLELVGGRLVLRGDVASEDQARDIVAASARVRGVTSVESRLRVRSEPDLQRSRRAQ
jgi:hypothetical protein